MASGYPETNANGDWADGIFKGEEVSGWVQMLSTDGTDLQVDHGFSGTGVWDEVLQGFAGIIVANQKRGGIAKPIAYMIPGSLLKRAWEGLSVAPISKTEVVSSIGRAGGVVAGFRSLSPRIVKQYHVFLASPGDVNAERQYVRRFFDDYNRSTAHLWNAEFRVIDWENYATIGVGRPQELITQQTLEKYKGSLALVVGIMGQRFGSPSGKAESGTEEEFNWAIESNKTTGFPEIKWFFRKADKLEIPSDPDEAEKALGQWRKVVAFRKRMQDFRDPVFYTEYAGADGFREVFDRDLTLWLSDASRPWAAEWAAEIDKSGGSAMLGTLPLQFDSDRYRDAILKKFGKLNLEMLDTTGAYYSGVRLWSVFVPQSVRECHKYNPRLLEIPKEHQKRLLESGEISPEELAANEQQMDLLRRDYFNQPLRPVLEVIDGALGGRTSQAHRLVILGDPGSGKSSLIRYLALRWANIADQSARDTQPIPLAWIPTGVLTANGHVASPAAIAAT
jgi:hypothetical protein